MCRFTYIGSNCCGAVASFLREEQNGYLFIPGDIPSIRSSIEKLLLQPKEYLLQMARNSRKLGMQITPSKVANTLLTVLK